MQIYTIASFNLIDVNPVTERVAKKLMLDTSDEGVSPRMVSMGFESANQINNLGIVFLFMLVIGVSLIVALIIAILAKFPSKI